VSSLPYTRGLPMGGEAWEASFKKDSLKNSPERRPLGLVMTVLRMKDQGGGLLASLCLFFVRRIGRPLVFRTYITLIIKGRGGLRVFRTYLTLTLTGRRPRSKGFLRGRRNPALRLRMLNIVNRAGGRGFPRPRGNPLRSQCRSC